MTLGVARCRNGLHERTPANVRRRPRANGGAGAWICVPCVRAADRRRHERDGARRRAAARERYSHDPDYREAIRAANLRAKFGLSLADYAARLAAQGGGCAICGTDEPGGRWGASLHVDHDHATGEVRGLLCAACNVMLGNAGDDPARLRAAADYLDGGAS